MEGFSKEEIAGCAHCTRQRISRHALSITELVPVNVMCGRYRLTAKERYLRDHFGLDEDPSWTTRWNIAASQLVPVLRRKTDRSRLTFDLVRWGLIPSWAKDLSIATKTINAMSETAAEKPAFRDALRFRRCLIPADAFYDWQSGGPKQKQAFRLAWPMTPRSPLPDSGNPGLAQNVKSSKPAPILTTMPNFLMTEVQRRMPVILERNEYDLWLDPGIEDSSIVSRCLAPFDATRMKKYPVGSRVNRPENDEPECAQQVSVSPAITPSLF